MLPSIAEPGLAAPLDAMGPRWHDPTMRYFDVFNGDADGICSLHQLRLAEPREAALVTGLKREISLLKSVNADEGDIVTVLDISLDRNRVALQGLLDRGAVVHYFDHHYAGEVPSHPRLHAHLDDSASTCTSAIVNGHLRGRFAVWAAVGAFGDGFEDTALGIAAPLGLDEQQVARLRELGRSLNYSAYGESESDVLVGAAELYRIVSGYPSPFELIDREPLVARLTRERKVDLQRALALSPMHVSDAGDVWLLADDSWARRVNGTFANCLAVLAPDRAHAVLTPKTGGGYLVSVRCGDKPGHSAVDFCRKFGGGGRATAGGIDELETDQLESFICAFDATYAR
jgi:hypothetical protein